MSIFSFFDVKKQLAALRERVDEVAHDMDKAKLDYDELYERVRRLLGKLARREQAEAESSSHEESHSGGGENGSVAGPVSLPARRSELIKRQVEALRKGLPMPKE